MDHSLVVKPEESTHSDGGAQRSLVGCSLWGRRESDTTGPPEEAFPGIELDQGVRRVRVYGKSPGLSAGEERRLASACGFAMGGSAQGELCGLKPDPFILSSPPDETGYHLELSLNEVPKNAVSHLSIRGATGKWTHCTDEEGMRWGFPGGSVVKYPPANAGDAGNAGSIPGLGLSSGGGHDNPLRYPCLENPMDRGAWQAAVHGVTKSRTRLRD